MFVYYRKKFRSNFEKYYKQIEARVNREALGCRSESNVPEDMRNIMKNNGNLNNEEMGDEIYKFLTEKYTTRKWLVMVYDEVSGFENHCLHNKFHTVFRESGRNAAAHSSDLNAENLLDDRTKDAFHTNLEYLKEEESQFGFPLESAERAYDMIGSPNRGGGQLEVAVVMRNKDLRVVSSSDYLFANSRKFTIVALQVGLYYLHKNYNFY